MVTASTMVAVLRPYVDRMEFTAVVPPLGLIRYAQREGLLSNSRSQRRTRTNSRRSGSSTRRPSALRKSGRSRRRKGWMSVVPSAQRRE
eukprot:3158897-Prymnesium_polylepis.2